MMDQNPALQAMTTFPLKALSKEPAVPWRDHQGGISKECISYGIDCHRSNLVVVDLDIHSDEKNGLLSWALLTRDRDIEDTFSVNTANGGIHYYYQDTTQGSIRNSTAKLGPGIDIRANGGYVVGPGSRVLDSNGKEAEYLVRDNLPIKPLPTFLRELLLPHEETISSKASVNKVQTLEITTTHEASIKGAIQAIVVAEEGERNNTLNKEAYRLASEGVPKEVIRTRLSMAAQASGLEAKEVEKTITSSVERGYEKAEKARAEKEKKEEDLLKSPQSTPGGYFSDIVMAYRLRESMRQDNYAWIGETNQWMRYSNEMGIWEEIGYGDIISRITDWCHEEVTITSKKKNVDMIKASMRCLNKSTVSSLATLVGPQLKVNAVIFDNRPSLLVVENGVVNLRTKELGPFNPRYYITQRIPLPYDPTVKSPYVDQILDALPDDAREWFMIMAGQSLTGYKPSDDAMFFLKGSGSNGKSTILNLMNATAGTYGGLPSQSSLVRSRNNDQFSIMGFKGIRQAIVEELPDKQLDTTRLKALTGTEEMTGRALYKNDETFTLHCTIWVSCNILPQVLEYDHATWRRIALIEFTKTYHKNEADVKGPNDRKGSDQVRFAALRDEKTKVDFLARRVEGAYKWYQGHMSDPALPPSVVQATNAWRYSGDNIRLWMEECLEPDKGSAALNEDLRDSYNNWLQEHGYSPISHKVFLNRLVEHPLFIEWDLSMVKAGRLGKLALSPWSDPTKRNSMGYTPRRIEGAAASHVKFVKFAS